MRRPCRTVPTYASGWIDTPFTELHGWPREDLRWRVHALDSGHNLMHDVSEERLEILLGTSAGTSPSARR
jgi:hypothetical protein